MKILAEVQKGALPNEGKWEDVALVISKNTIDHDKAYSFNDYKKMYESDGKKIYEFLRNHLPSGTYNVIMMQFLHYSRMVADFE